MSKRAEMPQSRRHVLVFDEDWDWLEANYGRYSQSRIGTGVAVRKILHAHIRALKQQVQDNLDARQFVNNAADTEYVESEAAS